MALPAYVTSENIYYSDKTANAAVLLTNGGTKWLVPYDGLDGTSKTDLDGLVAYNGGTLPLASETVSKTFILANGKSWYDTYLGVTKYVTLADLPSSSSGSSGGGSGGLTNTELRASPVPVSIPSAVSTNATVLGNVAAGATDAGNPIKMGGVYTNARPTYTAGQRTEFNTDTRGNLAVTLFAPNNTLAIDAGGFATDANSTATAGIETRSRGLVYNGTTWDRQRGDTTGTFMVGNVAAATADSGNPVKVAGVYRATAPTYTDGQRGDVQLTTSGSVKVTISSAGGTMATVSTVGDGVANNLPAMQVSPYNLVFNGTTWDRQRGDTTGSYVVGNVANSAADTGNPVKVGGVNRTTRPTYTDGQRTELQLDTRGNLATAIYGADGTTAVGIAVMSADAIAGGSAAGLNARNFNLVYNGTTWDRQRGDTNATYVKAPPTSGTDRSGTATTTASSLMVSNTNRTRFFIKNDDVTDIWIALGAPVTAAIAAGNIKIPANGGYFELEQYTGSINVIAASGTAVYTAREF